MATQGGGPRQATFACAVPPQTFLRAVSPSASREKSTQSETRPLLRRAATRAAISHPSGVAANKNERGYAPLGKGRQRAGVLLRGSRQAGLASHGVDFLEPERREFLEQPPLRYSGHHAAGVPVEQPRHSPRLGRGLRRGLVKALLHDLQERPDLAVRRCRHVPDDPGAAQISRAAA